uniref:LHH domain-containing protein n=1 Tax=Caenorhabditis tropicalis TaxID=1561998 RepID=A0A1I7TLM4_9PELO
MSHLKTEGTLIKSIHYTGEQPEEFDPMKPCFSDDLTPLTGYSLNKRRRWELQNKVGHQMMEDLQKFHGNTPDKILFLERVNLKTFEWKYLPFVHFPKDFLINSLHSLKKSQNGNVYKFSKLNSIFGQTYTHFLDENRKPDKKEKEIPENSTVVVYNFIRSPKNYMTLGEQNFVASNYGGRYPYYAYEKRKANWKDFQQDIKDGIREHYNGTDLRKMK